MTIEQILALANAGFTAEQITTLQAALTDEKPEAESQHEEQEAQHEEQEEQHQEQEAQHTEPEAPAWFGKFLQRYNEDIEQLSKGVKAKNVRRAGSDPGAEIKSPEQLMAEAYNNIR